MVFIYNETEGTPFCLIEYIGMLKRGESIETISPGLKEFLQLQFMNLPQDAIDLATTLSYFYDGAPLDLVATVLGQRPEQLLQPLDCLESRGLVTEQDDEVLSFTHCKLREYLYQTQQDSRKRIIHRKIAILLEKDIHSYKQYPKLVYHFSAAGNQLKAMEYKIASLNNHLNFSHEIFPVDTEDESISDQLHYVSRDKIKGLFRSLESDIQTFRATEKNSQELQFLEMEFLYMRGRYFILDGNYESGITDISYVIKVSKQLNRTDYIFEGYKQLIYYYFQINDEKGMCEYIEPALDLAVQCNNHKEIGILLRLKGLYHMMTGDYTTAQRLLEQSVSTLSITERCAKCYTINIAAAYGYMGEICQAQEDFTGALQLFNKAISLCPSHVLSGLSIFYINAGRASYFLRNYQQARGFFDRAYSLYEQFDHFWLRPTLDAYMALTLIEEGQLKESLHYLEMARENMWRMKYPGDLGTVFFAEALIRKYADQNEQIRMTFHNVLSESADRYYQLALKHLNQHLDHYEISHLDHTFSQ